MLKYQVDTLEGLEESLHAHYKEADGKFTLDLQGGAKPEEVARLTSSLTKERADHKVSKDKLGEWGQLTAAEVLPQLDEIDELRLKAESADGKLDEDAIAKLVETRVNRETAPIIRERDKLQAANTTLTDDNAALHSTITGGTISAAITTAATESKILSSALPDVQMLAERIFEVDGSGEVVVKDDVGYTAGITPKDFLMEIQEKRTHWWPSSEGGGSGGGGASSTGKNPWSKDNWNLTEQGSVLKAKGREAADKMAVAAGTTVEAGRPSS